MNKKSKNAKSTTPGAIELLKKDHATVKELLSQLEKTTSRSAQKRAQLLAKIAHEIFVHTTIEEEIFYPAYHAAAKSQQDSKLFFEATEEHGLVDGVIAALHDEDPSSEVYGAKCKVLKDLVEHHAEEEEDEMFPRANKLLGKPRLLELGQELQARKLALAAREPATRSSARSNGASAATRAPERVAAAGR